MTGPEIKQIAIEIEEAMLGRKFGKIFPLTDRTFAVDFNPHAGCFLFMDFGSRAGSAFLIVRKLKEIGRSSVHSGVFVIQLRRLLTGRELTKVSTRAGAIWMDLAGTREPLLSLIVQLRGKPNVLLLSGDGIILHAAISSDVEGQKVGDVYACPGEVEESNSPVIDPKCGSLSAVLDAGQREKEAETIFASLAKAARKRIKAEIAKRQRLLKKLEGDLAEHGNADEWKMFGDLILSNISNLRREKDTVWVTDYFDPEMRERAIAADHNLAPSEVAEAYFRKYTKARNALIAITERKKTVIQELEQMQRRSDEIESAVTALDASKLAEFEPVKQADAQISKERKKASEFNGARKFVSSDGFEIFVGKKAKDNDHLTFRIAKSHEMWMHAADYPGSHVIIRNPNRRELPVSTLIEAARLAVFYSDAREKPKAAVNYTPKKFVNKPKRAAAGLASLSSFKTILVESGFPDTVEKV